MEIYYAKDKKRVFKGKTLVYCVDTRWDAIE